MARQAVMKPLAPKASARCLEQCGSASVQGLSVRMLLPEVAASGGRCYTTATCVEGPTADVLDGNSAWSGRCGCLRSREAILSVRDLALIHVVG
jgi:hypothetical protein